MRTKGAIAALWIMLPAIVPAHAATGGKAVNARASIRVTSHGVFHILAKDYVGAGFGVGYAQASEAICDIADRIVTVNAERSRFFGPDAATGDFLNNPINLDSDFFWKRIHDAGLYEREMRLAEPVGPSVELRQMIQGYAAGYNKYLQDTGVDRLPDARCRGKAWVRPISEKDIFLRAMHWNLFRSGSMMLSQIVAAAPPGAAPAKVAVMDDLIREDEAKGFGSNMMALGAEATDNGKGMMFANPHWTWYGSDRWMEMQVTIPGKLNVIGMMTLGLPVVQTGFNENTAWAGTTSMPMRYTLYRLKLGSTPTSYVVDGTERKMTRRVVEVSVPTADGGVRKRDHAFWETPEGLMVVDPTFKWTADTGYVMRDVGYSFRWLSQQLRLNRAKSAQDLSDSGKAYMAIGWRNLSAADDQGNVFYGDRTAVPAVSDALLKTCGLENLSSKVLVLDGQRSSCGWQTVAGAPVPGIFSANQLPQLHRRDYIIQSNDTHWLNNARAPLEGFPKIMGAERTPRDLRTRNALLKVETRLAGTDGYPGNRFTLNLLKTITMNNRVYSADIWLDDLVQFCREQTDQKLLAACHILSIWDRTENIDSPGALLWRQFAMAIERVDPDGVELSTTAFDVKQPLLTPRGLKASDPRVRTALEGAMNELERAGIPLDATLRRYQYAVKGTDHIPISGGEAPGQYNLVYNDWVSGKGYPPIVGGPTFIMWMQFTPKGPVGESVLAFSQSPNTESPLYADQTRMWSEMRTKTMRFREQDILADPNLKTMEICNGRGC